jgi:catechol 2,3-dioxygenase-like lactoylglutathione lyase family enzyme
MQVDHVDFVTIPTRDEDAALDFYHGTLGLPLDPNNPREVRAGQLTLAFWNPEADGVEFSPNLSGFAMRVPDVDAARAELEERGVKFAGTEDSGVCRMAFFQDPDGNWAMLHRRYAPYE